MNTTPPNPQTLDKPDEFRANGPSVEFEHKLRVPAAQVEEVWQVARDGLKSGYLGPDYTVSENHVVYADQYYDSPDLALMTQGCGLRHRVRLSGDYTEVIQLKIEDKAAYTRIEHSFTVWTEHYRKTSHNFIDKIVHEQRTEFRQQLKTLGVDAEQLCPTIELHQNRRRLHVSDAQGKALLTLSLDEVRSRFWWEHFQQTDLEIELDSPDAEALAADIAADLQATFPGLQADQTPKYHRVFNHFSGQFIRFPTALRYHTPVEVAAGGVLLLGALGLTAWLSRHR